MLRMLTILRNLSAKSGDGFIHKNKIYPRDNLIYLQNLGCILSKTGHHEHFIRKLNNFLFSIDKYATFFFYSVLYFAKYTDFLFSSLGVTRWPWLEGR